MSFICVVPLFTEMMPKARSVPLAILALLPPIGRAFALVFVGSIAVAGGFKLIGIAAAVVTLIAVLIFGRFVPEA